LTGRQTYRKWQHFRLTLLRFSDRGEETTTVVFTRRLCSRCAKVWTDQQRKKTGCQSLAVLDLIAPSSRGATPDSVSAAAAPRAFKHLEVIEFDVWVKEFHLEKSR